MQRLICKVVLGCIGLAFMSLHNTRLCVVSTLYRSDCPPYVFGGGLLCGYGKGISGWVRGMAVDFLDSGG